MAEGSSGREKFYYETLVMLKSGLFKSNDIEKRETEKERIKEDSYELIYLTTMEIIKLNDWHCKNHNNSVECMNNEDCIDYYCRLMNDIDKFRLRIENIDDLYPVNELLFDFEYNTSLEEIEFEYNRVKHINGIFKEGIYYNCINSYRIDKECLGLVYSNMGGNPIETNIIKYIKSGDILININNPDKLSDDEEYDKNIIKEILQKLKYNPKYCKYCCLHNN
jgi:hypothetical protein